MIVLIYLLIYSPSGCTFWGKKPWSRKKKIMWQLGMLVGAPVGIALIAGIAVPAIIIGIPVWVGRKVRYFLSSFYFTGFCNVLYRLNFILHFFNFFDCCFIIAVFQILVFRWTH